MDLGNNDRSIGLIPGPLTFFSIKLTVMHYAVQLTSFRDPEYDCKFWEISQLTGIFIPINKISSDKDCSKNKSACYDHEPKESFSQTTTCGNISKSMDGGLFEIVIEFRRTFFNG